MQKTNTPDLKEAKPHGSASFACAFYEAESNQEGLTVPHHWHKEIEIIYLKKGRFRAEIDMENYRIPEESILFIHSGELHYLCSEGAFEESAVVFDPHIISFDSYDLVQRQLIGPLLSGRLRFPRYLNAEDPLYADLRREYGQLRSFFAERQSEKNLEIIDNTQAGDMVTQLQIKTSILKILLLLAGKDKFLLQEKGSNHQVEEIKKILTYIEERYQEKIYIQDLAGILNVNQQYFCRLFKKAIGKPPMEYVNEVRIKNAAHLLVTSDMRVMDICLETGFNNLGNFLREFRKHTGTTPLQYRKNTP